MTDKLVEQLRTLSNFDPRIVSTREQAANRIATLEHQNKALREALEWYADPAIYKPHPHGPAFDRRDLSFHARAVLKEQSA